MCIGKLFKKKTAPTAPTPQLIIFQGLPRDVVTDYQNWRSTTYAKVGATVSKTNEIDGKIVVTIFVWYAEGGD